MYEQGVTINKIMARAFINMVQLEMCAHAAEGLQANEMDAARFAMITQAQLTVLGNIGQLVTDKSEVLKEYDRMLELLTQMRPDGSANIMILKQGRPHLQKLMDIPINH